jgi:hypothetical protein
VGSSGLRVFVVEAYLPDRPTTNAVDIAGRLDRAQEVLRQRGREIRWLHALLLPRDEAWLCVCAAADPDDVRDLSRLASVAPDAVVEAQLVVPGSPLQGPSSCAR